MSTIKTYEGVVENGQIRFNANVRLPENAHVFVVVLDAGVDRPHRVHSPKLVDSSQLKDFAKQVMELEDDA